MNPRDLVRQVEQKPCLPEGEDERFSGYGVMALPFRSGHILGLRRFPASSIGPAYTSVWHRDPQAGWTFYSDVAPQLSCNRYFGSGVQATRQCAIEIVWNSPDSFSISVNEGELDWQVNLESPPVSRLMSAVCRRLPRSLWRQTAVLTGMGAVGGRMLRAGKITLRGQSCNGQEFQANPLRIWTISNSPATLRGERLGEVGAIPRQARLGDFYLPQRGLFIIGQVFMEQYDPARHRAAMTSDGNVARMSPHAR